MWLGPIGGSPGIDNGLGLSGNAAYWHTIMIVGERFGGTYYVCLDITKRLEPRFMWEFTTNRMGFTFAETNPNPPPIGPIWIGFDPLNGDSVSTPAPRWVAMLGGGWDTDSTYNTSPSARGRGFYIVDIATGRLVWKYDQTDTQGLGAGMAMGYHTPATPALIAQTYAGSSHPWWMEAFEPDLGTEVWQFSFQHVADGVGQPTSWGLNYDSGDDLAKTCGSNTDNSGCVWPQLVFSQTYPNQTTTPEPSTWPFYYQVSAVGDMCSDVWVGVASGDRNNPLMCPAIGDYLVELKAPLPYVPIGGANPLNAGNLIGLSNTTGTSSIDACGGGINGWYMPLATLINASATGGTKSISVTYASSDVDFLDLFTPLLCASGSTSQFGCSVATGSGKMVGVSIFANPGAGVKGGQVVFRTSLGGGVPSAPINTTSVMVSGGGSSSGNSTTPTPQYSIPGCNGSSATYSVFNTTSGFNSNAGITAGVTNGWSGSQMSSPYFRINIPRNVERDLRSPSNTWSSHGR